MIYLTGCTNDRDEPTFIRYGVGLMIQPRSSYAKRVERYAYWAADNGKFNPATYIGDDKWLDWVDRLPRDRCLFVVVPDVARRPDGSLGGDPVATWKIFEELGPVVQSMGFPVALAAQNGIEDMPNLREQIEAADCVFIAGDTEWKLGPGAAKVAGMARALGKWVHMGRVNSQKRMEIARAMGCQSADGTALKYRRRGRAADDCGDLDRRGAVEIARWQEFLRINPSLPFTRFEGPGLAVHREAHDQTDTHR